MITGKGHRDKSGTGISGTVVDTLATAAVAIIKELKEDKAKLQVCISGGMSPGKKVELRS